MYIINNIIYIFNIDKIINLLKSIKYNEYWLKLRSTNKHCVVIDHYYI